MIDSQEKSILTGWSKRTSPKLWCLSICPQHQPGAPTGATTASLKPFSAYNILSVEAIVRYLNSDAGFPVRSNWLASIKAGNYSSCPGLTYQNAIKYCPTSTKTTRGHMNQTWQGLHATTRPCTTLNMDPAPPIPLTDLSVSPANELHVSAEPISKLYIDNSGRFPVRSRRRNQCIMIS